MAELALERHECRTTSTCLVHLKEVGPVEVGEFELLTSAKSNSTYIVILESSAHAKPSPNSLEVEHQSCKLEVLSSILSLGFRFR